MAIIYCAGFSFHNNENDKCISSAGRRHAVPGAARRSYLNRRRQQLRYFSVQKERGSKQLLLYLSVLCFLKIHLEEDVQFVFNILFLKLSLQCFCILFEH